jgi:hypothetical protein
LKEGDCTPIFKLSNKLWSLSIKANIFTPAWFLGLYDEAKLQTPLITLADLENMDFSKYIPTDNAILFLDKDDADKYADKCEAWFLYQENLPTRELNSQMDIRDYKKITIFIDSLDRKNLNQINELAKELKEKYGVEEVNVFALHCWTCQEHYGSLLYCDTEGYPVKWKKYRLSPLYSYCYPNSKKIFVNKLITTNSTRIFKTKNKDDLKVINCYDIFKDWLKGE